MNYYKVDFPIIDAELKAVMVSEAIEMYSASKAFLQQHRIETTDTGSINFIEPDEIKFYTETAGVTLNIVSKTVKERLRELFIGHPIASTFTNFIYVIVDGGSFCPPHSDDSQMRTECYQYLLKSGGSNVRTIWYEPKEDAKELSKLDYTPIPYTKLNVVEDHCVEEDTWGWWNVNTIHSVENIESIRILLFPVVK